VGLLKDFNISNFKKMKPHGNYTFDTMQEIKLLKKIPLNKKFVKDYDDIEGAFEKTAKRQGLDYDNKIAAKLIKESAPIILKLKKHFDRPRPKVLAKKMNIKLNDYEMESMKTPSYPSGHSAQSTLIANILSDKYPKAKKAFMQTAKNISDSRNIAHAHYKSDSDVGKKLGVAMYEHIKNKTV
tara:strand:+ start:47 stop:595 length:549 start_codon:yes stop_codon:yes gene_type:complete